MANHEPKSSTPFGLLLRQLREQAEQTQEELAEVAGVASRTISDLERGINLTARKDTAKLLAEAMHLTGAELEVFMTAARGRPTTASATRTLPGDVTAFVGRGDEMRRIADIGTGNGSSVFVVGGMAGVGKTAFAVHVAHHMAERFPDGQLFISLHAHTPGLQPADAEDALASLLQATGVAMQRIPRGIDARAAMWRSHLAGRRLVLLLDDALDSEQVRPLLPGTPGGLVLITSRMRLMGLDNSVAIDLDALPTADASGLLVSVAMRADLDRADPAVAEIAGLCGNLPLALGMMARRLHHHQSWSAGDLAADMVDATERRRLLHTEDLSVAAAFDLSYQDLTDDQKRMFRRLGMQPGTEFDAYVAAALGDIGVDAARQALEDLYDHYLVSEPAKGRYKFHDLIREYAHASADTDKLSERIAATDRALDYYLYMARVVNSHLRRGTPDVAPAEPRHKPVLASSQEAIAWMESECQNLRAAAEYAAGRERRSHAVEIPAAMHEFLRRQGHWRQALALDALAVRAAEHGDGQGAEARARADLADIELLTGDYDAAVVNLSRALGLHRSLGSRIGEANTLTQLGEVSNASGDRAGAATYLTEALKIYRGIGNRLGEANALTELADVQESAGELGAAESGLAQALEIYGGGGEQLREALALIRLGSIQHMRGQNDRAIATVSTALTMFRELGDRPGEARALNSLGELALAVGAVGQARSRHDQALVIVKSMNAPREQARALEGLGRCHIREAQPVPGCDLLRQALAIYEQMKPPQAQRIEEILTSLGELEPDKAGHLPREAGEPV